MITPRPVKIGSEMTVRCAADTVGGVQVFTDLDKTKRYVHKIHLKVSETEIWASYSPADAYPDYIKVIN